MKHRIGLITSKSAAAKPARSKSASKTTTTFVEAATTKELAAELTKLGATRAGLYWRDRVGDGHLEGETFPVAKLADTHFEWVTTAAPAVVRALYYDTKG